MMGDPRPQHRRTHISTLIHVPTVIHVPTLGGDLCHPPPGIEPTAEGATGVARLCADLVPIHPQRRHEVVTS
jgi:hypothetical protein